ncbi:MAG: 6-phosphogluconolactonase [Acidobacteriota bacterium]
MNYGKTRIVICQDEFDLGSRAAHAVSACMRGLLQRQEQVRMILAAGESQMTFLDALAQEPDLEWNRVVCFNVDDFWDPSLPEQYTCGYQVRTQLYDKVRPHRFHLVDFRAPDPQAEAERFARLLKDAGPVDILCQGIGTSGHLALNEPFQTDFQDPHWVRVVDLAEQSKVQLAADPNFQALSAIPDKGITMTIPAMLSAPWIFTMVPLSLKRPILTRLLATSSPTVSLPASILRTVDGTLFTDKNSWPEQPTST